MTGSVKEDQEPRANTGREDSRAMTIKFLRARLLSERSVSKTAMQRAEELSKRVMELEEQLKFMSIQRNKAEKAMADVLAILENHGISDMPEGFDSNSDQDGTLHDFRTDQLMLRETSTKNEARKNEMGDYYSSEIESSPSTGESLTWKTTKDSQYSLQKKKQVDSISRRTSFALNGSSARRTVKSCRRIRRKETRAVEEFQNDGPVKASFSIDVSNSFDGETDALWDSNNLDSGEKPVDNLMLESESGSQKFNGRYITVHERDKDMESALQHQAQLIGQYEKEEKAQREWEEKFRESNSCERFLVSHNNLKPAGILSSNQTSHCSSCEKTKIQDMKHNYSFSEQSFLSKLSCMLFDSGDPGNCSDVTEERNDIKLPEVADATGMLCPNNQETVGICFSEDHAPKCLPSLTDAKKKILQDSSKSPESEVSILVSNEKSTPLFISPSSTSSLNLTIARQETSTSLGSVLEALQQAKSSLQEKLSSLSLVDGGTSNTHDTFKVPTGFHALLRLPNEDQYKATTIANHPDIGVPSIFSSFPHEVSGGKFFNRPYVDPRMALSNEVFSTAPSSTFTETSYRVPPQRSLSQPRPGIVPPSYNQTNHIGPYTNIVLPSVRNSYPFLPDFTPTMRTSSSSETLLPPVTHLRSYNELYRSYTNR
ncbi:uncharacterized protein LOC142548826 isoform X1 [Primulina tabacum]|uniref:uncharacterized protein LOC142548826 isoform X1 n=1 Tax=Primulina tabacum TaxID=48773 RepID=UPI003F5A7DF7